MKPMLLIGFFGIWDEYETTSLNAIHFLFLIMVAASWTGDLERSSKDLCLESCVNESFLRIPFFQAEGASNQSRKRSKKLSL